MKKISKICKLIFFLTAFSLLIFGFEAKSQIGLNPMAAPSKPILPSVALNWWVVWDNPADFSGLINNFRAQYPHVNINVRKLRYDEYKDALIQAWARDEGPDLFSLPNTWVREYEEWAEPLPDKVVLKKEVESGPGCFRKKKVVNKTEYFLKLNEIKEKFVSQIEKDVIIKGKILALPLNTDSLVMFYNRDLLDAAKIPLPPKNWTEFSEQVKKLTLLDKDETIYQAGTALGTANNLERPVDILSLLMMQVGAKMSDPNGYANFNQSLASDPTYFPAEEALRFYTDFQNKDKEVYTWDKEMPSALEFFNQGKLAFFFGYAYHLPLIKNQAPNLNFGLAKMPQPEGAIKEINFANYQVQAVAKKSKNKDLAWAFLNQAALAPQDYLNKTKKPTALRSLIDEQIKDPDLEILAGQALTSQSWYLGKNALVMEEAFKEMIESVNEGKKTYLEAINFAAQKINQTIK